MPDPAIAAVSRVTAVPSILRVITETTGLRLSLIARVTEDAWTCCAVNDQMQFGLEVGGTLELATTLCTEVRQGRAPIVISHASADATYCNHPTPKQYGFESYISVPIFLRSGEYFGNVCGLDAKPIDLHQPKTLAMFQLFAELIGVQIEAEARHALTVEELFTANTAAHQREQFISMLAHDLRSPLNAITLGAEALRDANLGDRPSAIAGRIGRGAARMGKLVEEVVDFTRGRLGTGIPLNGTRIPQLQDLVRQGVDEVKAGHPTRAIELVAPPAATMWGDPGRISQLLQNLLENAVAHGPADAPITVTLAIDEHDVMLTVANGGPDVPAELLSRMFEPYQRGPGPKAPGLGLGLYIASQIVESHHGTIGAASAGGTTTITVKLPRAQAATGSR